MYLKQKFIKTMGRVGQFFQLAPHIVIILYIQKLPMSKKGVFHVLIFFCYTVLVAAQQLPHSPLDRKVPQVRVVLANSHKHHGHVGRVNQTD